MAIDISEILWFLASPSSLTEKKFALDTLQTLTDTEKGMKSIDEHADFLFHSLFFLFDEPKLVSEPMVKLLVNLSQDFEIASKMIRWGMVRKIKGFLFMQEEVVRRWVVILLVKLTQQPAGISSLLQTRDVKMQWSFILKLVNLFCTTSNQNTESPFGSILVNIAKSEDGRRLLLDPERGLLRQIIQQFDSTSPLRRMLVSGTTTDFDVKVQLSLFSKGHPCLFFGAEEQLNDAILKSDFLWLALLLPVAGKKVYIEQDTSKMPMELSNALMIERERVDDPEIRIQALRAIHLIALQEVGQRALRSVSGFLILEAGFKEEADPKVIQAYTQILLTSQLAAIEVPLVERLTSQLATIEYLESIGFIKKASCMAHDAICDVVCEDKEEELIVQKLKAKSRFNGALSVLNRILKNEEEDSNLRWKVYVVLKRWNSRLMDFLLSGTNTRVFLILQERYPRLMTWFRVMKNPTDFEEEMFKLFTVRRILWQEVFNGINQPFMRGREMMIVAGTTCVGYW